MRGAAALIEEVFGLVEFSLLAVLLGVALLVILAAWWTGRFRARIDQDGPHRTDHVTDR